MAHIPLLPMLPWVGLERRVSTCTCTSFLWEMLTSKVKALTKVLCNYLITYTITEFMHFIGDGLVGLILPYMRTSTQIDVGSYYTSLIQIQKKVNLNRGHLDLNQWPLDLQSNALPLSYTPNFTTTTQTKPTSLNRWKKNNSDYTLLCITQHSYI